MSKQKEPNEIEQLQKEKEEWRSKYLRALADYQNLEKRIATQRRDDMQYAGRAIITKLLPIIDVFEKVTQHIQDQGLALAVKQLSDIPESENVKKIEVLGKPFDPHTMECIEVVEGEKEDIVVEEIQPGYRMHDQVIRVARVKVGKKKESTIDKAQSSH